MFLTGAGEAGVAPGGRELDLLSRGGGPGGGMEVDLSLLYGLYTGPAGEAGGVE